MSEVQLSGMKGRALSLLAAGVPQSQVAQNLGVSESAISQLMGDEDFATLVAQKRGAVSERDQKFDEKLERAEEDALDAIASRVRLGNLQQSLQAFRILNQAKRRRDSGLAQQPTTQHVTNLILPAVLLPVYVKNQKSEIIEVDGKTMISASQSRLNEIVKERTGVEMAVVENKTRQAQEVLENVTRSVVRPARRNTRDVTDLVDLL